MTEIVIENTDGQIWHQEQVILTLVRELGANRPVTLSLNNEGPCATELGLYDLLDQICEGYQFDSKLITIVTHNLLEKTDRYQVINKIPFYGKGLDQLLATSKDWPYKTITDTTKHFGSFVGRSNRMRLAISSYLYYHYPDKTLLSYHTDVTNPYFDQFIGLEEMMFHKYDPSLIDDSYHFLKQCPISLDAIGQYPIYVDQPATNNIIDRYPEIFLEIVYQPFCLGNTFFLDEKLWRTIGTRTPFIVQGPKNFLHNLRRLGFKTFDRWWDEGYSEDPPDYQVSEIIKVVDTVAAWTPAQLATVYEEMKPILEHNHATLMSLTQADFKRIFEYA